MKIACVGGGPAGLLLAILMKTRQPDNDITVYERNRRGDTFGFGVVFSDETLSNIADADPPSFQAIEAEFRYWSAMDVRRSGQSITSDGHGFAALSRVRLLDILSQRALDVGVRIEFETNITGVASLGDVDLIVGADGVNSGLRSAFEQELVPTISRGPAKYIWAGTKAKFDRFTFIFEESEHGWVQAHVYPFNNNTSTFIVEMAESTWRAAGLDKHGHDLGPGLSDDHAISWCEELFANHLGGEGLIPNNSKWVTFPRISLKSWFHKNIVILGDAVHTAHYSIGSGTKLALEDAIELADALLAKPINNSDGVTAALQAYETARKPGVESLQRAATVSEDWFQEVDRHAKLPFDQFAFSLFTRSQRVTYDNLAERDSAFMDKVQTHFWSNSPSAHRPAVPDTPPVFFPYSLRDMTLHNRIVVSPMAQYSATGGLISDWHLVHLGSRAVGGAGLVMTEMTCTSPDARITPGCPGIWNDEQANAWSRVTTFVHDNSKAKMGLQIGHAGRKGSTKVAWEEMDAPLDDHNWPLVSASPLPYRPDSQTPEELSVTQMDVITNDFVRAATRANGAGFDLLEIHAAHGYLLSSFLSPVTNQRTDHFGGSLANRARFPLRVIQAVREAWPTEKPLSVRISATDWIKGGFDTQDAVAFAEMLQAVGVDIIDVSTGQVDQAEEPAYGRLYQTPFAEQIRNAVGIPTMAVGAITSIDDANTVLTAGRADLCLIARGHLIDPYWSMNAAVDLGQSDQPWPVQYQAGRTSRRREQSATAMVDRDLR